MRRLTVPRGVEAALERAVENPFLKRTAVNLPLLRGALRRAMEDELKPVVPSRYTITVSAGQIDRLGDSREEWERDLAEYFREVLRSNRWSAIGEPRVTIAYDPALTGNQIQVAVEEPGLIHNGGTFPRQWKHRNLAIASFVGILLVCVAMLVAVLRPDLVDALRGSRGIDPVQQDGAGWGSPSGPLASWWDGVGSGILGSVTGGDSGEVTASPCLVVRAGSPSSSGAARSASCIPTGTVLRWKQDQLVNGESVANDNRWLRIGTAGPEWGPRAGQPLYVWMGGLKVR